MSSSDEAVLNAIFNPLFPVTTEQADDNLLHVELDEDNKELKEVKQLELEGVQAAENGNLNTAFAVFDKAVQLMPERASCYNNRAQALRLKGDVNGALEDLNKAIELSRGYGKAACQAYIQRGLIRRLQGENEAALGDFQKAADLGSEFAKGQVVMMNPYAAMCNQMLSGVFKQLKSGEYQD